MLCNFHLVMSASWDSAVAQAEAARTPAQPPGGNPAPSSRARECRLLMSTVKCEVFHALGPRGGFLFSQYSLPWSVRVGKGWVGRNLRAAGWRPCILLLGQEPSQ